MGQALICGAGFRAWVTCQNQPTAARIAHGEAMTHNGLPDLATRGIICLSTIDWDFLWQRQQELMTRFARAGVPVVYVEPLGVRSARVADAGKIARRVRRWLSQGMRITVPVEHGLQRLSPYALPFQGHRRVDAFNTWLISHSIRRAISQLGLTEPVLWTYYATHSVLDLADALWPALLVYDCIDDVTRNARGVATDYAATERVLLSRADLVLATSSALRADKSLANRQIHLTPPGCNAQHFASPASEAADIASLPHPRLCFFGGIDERLDLELLATLARRRPDWTIVLLGVVRTDISSLNGLHNIVFVGQRPYQALPGYVQHMDALLLPYLLNEYTRRIYPAKVFECLATGKPVVATALPDLQQLAGALRILQPTDDPVSVIQQLLTEDSPEAAEERQVVARANSWDARFQEIQDLLLKALQAKDNSG